MRVAIVGGGVFGLSAAWRLAVRGHAVALFEAGTIPAEKAASRDVSKALRGGYGRATATYAPGVARGRELWRDLESATGRTVFHETGCLQMCTRFEPGVFEYDGHRELAALNWNVDVLDVGDIAKLAPGFVLDGVVAGVLDRWGGWIDPMAALPALAEAAAAAGAVIEQRRPISSVGDLASEHDAVLICAGAWASRLVDLGVTVRTTRQHEAFFRPTSVGSLTSLPAWSFDMATGGWYGFPPTADGMIKVARHVPDVEADPDGERSPDPVQAAAIRAFVERRMPDVLGARDEGGTCFYTMSPDGSFVFDAVPHHQRLWIAGCGGGHAFKFGPMLGEWAAALLEGGEVPSGFRLASKGADRIV